MKLNTDRYSLRRTPQTITSVVQPFNENQFNFKKVNEKEVILQCRSQLSTNSSDDGVITLLINNSPLTKSHSLICPRVHEVLPQIITKECIEFAIDVIFGFNDRSYRIGYNSLGAFASVNHLHIHLFHVPEKLYVEDAVSEILQIEISNKKILKVSNLCILNRKSRKSPAIFIEWILLHSHSVYQYSIGRTEEL